MTPIFYHLKSRLSPTLLALSLAVCAAPLIVTAEEAPNFRTHIQPIFKEHCNNCHNPDKKKGDLDLTSMAGFHEGDIAQAGTPDSSTLILSITHHEDYEPMPPKKAKLSDEKITLISDWITGGMLPHAGGESDLRDVSFNVNSGSSERPKDIAIPHNLPPHKTDKAPVLSLATSPWADVFAVSGHREIHLYSPLPPAAEATDYIPIAKDTLIIRKTFDDAKAEGVIGSGFLATGKAIELPEQAAEINLVKGFTIATWLRPANKAEYKQSPNLFGNSIFRLFLEAKGDEWNLRLNYRDQKKQSMFMGRIGTFPTDAWSHVAMTFDGSEFVTYIGGHEVSRQPVNDGFEKFFDTTQALTLAGIKDQPNYKGGIDDFRIYSRALNGSELTQITRNAMSQLERAGALPFDLGDIHHLTFSRNGNLLLAAGGKGAHSGAVNLYDVKTGKLQATIGDEQDVVLAADISPDHSLIALSGPSKNIKIHTTADGKIKHRIAKHTDWVTAMRFSPDGKFLASGDRNGGVHVWEAATGGIVFSLSEHKEGITDIAWRPDGEVLATTGEGGKLVLWSMKDGFPLRAVTAHKMKTTDRYTRLTGALNVQYLPNGNLFTSGRDRALRLWKTDGTKLTAFSNVPALSITAALTHDGTRALTGHNDGSILLWDLISGTFQKLTQ